MREVVILFLHLVVTIIRLTVPGGLRSVVAESMLVKHQLLILSRGRKRAPNLCAADRIITGLCTLLMRRMRVLRSAIVLKPSTLLNLHKLLTKRKYRLLFSPRHGHRPGPKGPKQDVIDAVVAMKRRNVLGLSSHRPADQASFRPRDRQGCCSSYLGVFITGPNRMREVRPGSAFWATRRIVYGAAICFAANRQP